MGGATTEAGGTTSLLTLTARAQEPQTGTGRDPKGHSYSGSQTLHLAMGSPTTDLAAASQVGLEARHAGVDGFTALWEGGSVGEG